MDGKLLKLTEYRSNATSKATTNDGIPVYCAHDELVPTKNLKPNPKNPNNHPDEQITLLSNIIEQTGWRQPITVSNLSGMVVKGHGRLQAATKKGWTNVPVDYQDYASIEEEYADLLADNRLSELSEIENEPLAEILRDIVDEDESLLNITGYDIEDIKQIMDEINGIADQEEDEVDIPDPFDNAGPFCLPGDIWFLGEHRLVVGDHDNLCDFLVSEYIHKTGNTQIICKRGEMEWDYISLLKVWADDNNVTNEVFKLRRPRPRQ